MSRTVSAPLPTLAAASRVRYADITLGRALLLVATGTALGAVSFPMLLSLVMLCGALLVTVLGAAVVFVVLVVMTHALAAAHRSRFRSLLGLHITAARGPDARDGVLGWLVGNARSGAFWRALVYGLVVGFGMLVSGLTVIAVAGWAAIAVTSLVHGGAALGGLSLGSTLRTDLAATGAGALVLALLPGLVRLLAWLDTMFATALLGRSQTDELGHRVEKLRKSRSEVVDAADAERRRIERDLHDGAQQRLTALAMNLGVARTTLTDLPEPARRALDDAHAEAKAALTELRATVRGLHPAVLDDRGLDAALSGLAGRSPVPVTLSVDLPQRPPRQVEAIAYFVVSEALTNVVKHSGATRVQVSVTLEPASADHHHRLRLRVVDDGAGGADPSRGTGLTGLRQRVASVDGTLTVESPFGGPTVLEAVLPCGS